MAQLASNQNTYGLLSQAFAPTASTTDARYADLLGDGLNRQPNAPADPNDAPNPANPGGVSNNQLAQQKAADAVRLQSVPYGTAASAGGTAQGYQVTSNQNRGASDPNDMVTTQPGDFTGPVGTRPDGTMGPTWQPSTSQLTDRNYQRSSGSLIQPSAPGTVNGTTTDSNGNVVTIRQGTPAQENGILSQLKSVVPVGSAGGAQQLSLQQPTPGTGNFAPSVTGNIAGTPGTISPNPPAAGAGGPAQPGLISGTPGASVGALPQIDQGLRDAQSLAAIGQTQGAGGAASRIDLANKEVQSFLNEERARKGPSEAEALLNKATDRTMANALGIASGARGTAEDRARATRSAISANAATGAEASQNVAQLRAKEANDQRQRLLQTLGIQSNNAASADQLGLGYTNTGAQLYGQGLNQLTNLSAQQNQQQMSADDRAWQDYMFNNMSASEKEAYRQAQLNRPTFAQQAVSTGLQLIPAIGTLARGAGA